jgi:hypothetical protein
MLVYASTDDLAAWLGSAAPANATPLLRSASLSVREATSLAFYATDSTGLPTDAATLRAFNDATCCQAAWLNAESIDPNRGGALATGTQTSIGIGSARITYADAAAAVTAKQQALTGLCPDAQRILRNAGLTPTAPWIVG